MPSTVPLVPGESLEIIARVDSKGRIVIPKELRDRLGIGRLVKIKVGDDKLIITPVSDPLEELKASVIQGTKNIAREIRTLRKAAEAEALKEVNARWSL